MDRIEFHKSIRDRSHRPGRRTAELPRDVLGNQPKRRPLLGDTFRQTRIPSRTAPRKARTRVYQSQNSAGGPVTTIIGYTLCVESPLEQFQEMTEILDSFTVIRPWTGTAASLPATPVPVAKTRAATSTPYPMPTSTPKPAPTSAPTSAPTPTPAPTSTPAPTANPNSDARTRAGTRAPRQLGLEGIHRPVPHRMDGATRPKPDHLHLPRRETVHGDRPPPSPAQRLPG